MQNTRCTFFLPHQPTQEAPRLHAGSTSHLFSHLPHQQALHLRTSAQTSYARRNHLPPFFTSHSSASTSPTHLCTNLLRPQERPPTFFHISLTSKHFTYAPLHKPPTPAGTTSHLFSHLPNQQALHLRTSAQTFHKPPS